MKNKIIITIVSIIIFVVLFVAGGYLYRQKEAQKLQSNIQEDRSIFVRDHSPRLGRAGAPVQVVEFMDPECESCREFHPFTKMLLQEYEGKMELILRYAPFHGNSVFVIKILEAARKQNRYWETLDILFQHQPEWGSHHHPRPELIWNYLGDIGLDVEQIRKDMSDPAILTMIEQEIADGKALGVRGTPTFFINGRELEEFSYEGLKAQIEKALR